MRGANIFAGIAAFAWFGASLIGLSMMYGVRTYYGPGYPNSGQIQHYVVYPVLIAAALVACAWLCNRGVSRPALLGSLSGASLLAILPYLMTFGGGV